MSRAQPTSRNGGATPASSLIIFLEQRVAELETQRDEADKGRTGMSERLCPKCNTGNERCSESDECFWCYEANKELNVLEAKVAELETESQRWQVSYRLQKKENYDLMTISIPELQLDLKDAQAKVAELRKENYDLMTKGDK